MKTILVYRDTILPISETFIKAQAESMARYLVRYCGMDSARPSLALSSDVALLNPDPSWKSSLRLSLYNRLDFAPGFKALIKSWGVSLIHAHFAPDGLRALPLARFLKVPLIVTLHGYDITKRDEPSKNYRALWKEADLFLCVSDFIRRSAIEKGFPRDKLLVHYIGVDESKFSAIPENSVKSPNKVLFVGRLVEKKGCQYLISAMREVQDVIPDAKLTIIGDGPLRASLQVQAKTLGVICDFLGAQDSTVISRHMHEAAVFCVPSVTAGDGDSEGFGIVFIEAQAAGVPVVSFRHGGIPEAVKDGVTGLLAPERDVSGLAKNIIRYLTDEELRHAAGKAGMDFVHEHYRLAEQTAKLESIYDQVLSDRVAGDHQLHVQV
jgi:colanic acid/amylovoran biosynthesis glycosyltransferase